MIGIEEQPHAVVAPGRSVVVEVRGTEEPILTGLRDEEFGEGPLHRKQHSDEQDARDESDRPWFPGARPLSEKVQGQRRNYEQHGKLGGHQMGQGIEYRTKLGLSRKKRQDQDLGDDEDHVD